MIFSDYLATHRLATKCVSNMSSGEQDKVPSGYCTGHVECADTDLDSLNTCDNWSWLWAYGYRLSHCSCSREKTRQARSNIKVIMIVFF